MARRSGPATHVVVVDDAGGALAEPRRRREPGRLARPQRQRRRATSRPTWSPTSPTRARAMPCPTCGSPLVLRNGIEVGNIFKLGTKYTEAFGARYLGEDGVEHPIVMGSYGIGLGRNVACIVEAHHDDKGIVWPAEVAPYAAHLVSIGGEPRPAGRRDRATAPRRRGRRGARAPVGRPRRVAGGQVHRRGAARDALDRDGQPALAGGGRRRGHRARDGRAVDPAAGRRRRLADRVGLGGRGCPGSGPSR